jgi:hypothetical protein
MAKDKTIRIYPDGGEWVVKKDSATKASARRSNQKDAIKAAREFAINQNLTMIIHGRDGKILRTVTPKEASTESCFITTACVKYYGLDDDCYQLETLRKFRDNHLLKSSQNKSLVEQYYRIAPILVKCLEEDTNRKDLFKEVFKEINFACKAIDENNFEKATNIYKDVVIYLMTYFKIR